MSPAGLLRGDVQVDDDVAGQPPPQPGRVVVGVRDLELAARDPVLGRGGVPVGPELGALEVVRERLVDGRRACARQPAAASASASAEAKNAVRAAAHAEQNSRRVGVRIKRAGPASRHLVKQAPADAAVADPDLASRRAARAMRSRISAPGQDHVGAPGVEADDALALGLRGAAQARDLPVESPTRQPVAVHARGS